MSLSGLKKFLFTVFVLKCPPKPNQQSWCEMLLKGIFVSFMERLRGLISTMKQNILKCNLLLSQRGRTLSVTALSAYSTNRIRGTYRVWKSKKGIIKLWRKDILNVFSKYRKRGNQFLFSLWLIFRINLQGNYWQKIIKYKVLSLTHSKYLWIMYNPPK